MEINEHGNSVQYLLERDAAKVNTIMEINEHLNERKAAGLHAREAANVHTEKH